MSAKRVKSNARFCIQFNFNFGNFLWGAAAQATGLRCFFAKLGSHVNAFLFPQGGRGRRGQFDTPDDILSINAGYAWSR